MVGPVLYLAKGWGAREYKEKSIICGDVGVPLVTKLNTLGSQKTNFDDF